MGDPEASTTREKEGGGVGDAGSASMNRLILPAQIGWGDTQLLPVLGHGSTSQFNVFISKEIDYFTIAQWFFGILLFNYGTDNFLNTGIGNTISILP